MPRIAKIIKVEVMTDLLSQLPDHLLHQILLKLATKDSVKTSVLSTRWRYLWKSVPGLYLDYFDFSGCKGLKGFINRFLDLDKKSVIYRFEMEFFDEEYETEVYKWTNQVVNRGVQYLVVVCNYYGGRTCKMKFPGSISTCETLVHLELEHVGIQRFDSVSLPSLKTLYLSSVWFSSDAAVERLISSSPALQLLDIEEVLNVEYLRVRSHTLNSLSICINKTNSNVHGEINGVVIVAPSLKCLSLKIHRFKDLVLNCVCSPTKVDIQILVFDEIDFCSINAPAMKTLRTFLACTSKVTNLSLHSYTLKALCAYTKFESLPQFSNLTRLNVSSSDKEWSLRTILASCPNLKSLDLEHLATRYYYHPPLKILDIFRLNQPKCLLTSLESVVIRHSVQTKIIEYLLRNAAVLKELTLQFRCRNAEHKFQFLKQILTFPRRSSACHIFVRTFCKCCENHVLV